MMSRLSEMPYRLFFPLGVILLLWGVFLWVPQIWDAGDYPVLLHRSLMLNGFAASFIGGFLLTAVPRFSKTHFAAPWEIFLFLAVMLSLLISALMESERGVLALSSLQPLVLLLFLFNRISKRKENPPYSFIFIFAGLFLWFLSGLLGIIIDPETFKELHYEGAIASIILGVGGRLIPGILGHVEIVSAQREKYEKPVPVLSTVPLHFLLMVAVFVVSYFTPEAFGLKIRAVVVLAMGVFYWALWKLPKERTALTWMIWASALLIVLSFLLRAYWDEGMIHAAHSFFINGIVLLSLLIATRVIQSHGPKDKSLENRKLIYFVGLCLILAAITRVTAYLMPESYLHHLGYSSIMLTIGVLSWAAKYLKYCFESPTERHP